MDSKALRPGSKRHDENAFVMPTITADKTADNGALKTIHHRHKSFPNFKSVYQADAVKVANKKVLADVNTNRKILQPSKDDSALDKKSAAGVKQTAALMRPPTRPQAKSVSSQAPPSGIVPAAPKPALTLIPEAVAEPKKFAIKKTTKVLKTADTEAEVKKPASTQLTQDQGGVALPKQDIRKTEVVQKRDESESRAQDSGVYVPSGFASAEEYMMYLDAQSHSHPAPNNGVERTVSVLPSNAIPAERYYEEEEDDSYYHDGYTTSRSFGLHNESTGGVTAVLGPMFTNKVEQELKEAKLMVESTRTPEDVEDEQWDTSMVAEYGDEIFKFMGTLEAKMAPNPRYMDQQTEIQWSMRAVLVDWVVQVHQRFGLLPETLFLTINYVDRFLSCKVVSLNKLQLVGATALFVAAKYEEVNCPTISEIIYMVDGGYTTDELLKAERFMLSMLQFELGWPGPMSFLRRISKADDYDLETRTLAKYFLEITIMDERMVGCNPSFTAAAAHCLARMMLGKGSWSLAHVHFSGYTYYQLYQLLQTILDCCEDPRKHHGAVFEKYSDKRFKRASTYVETQVARGFSLQHPSVSSRGSFSVEPLK